MIIKLKLKVALPCQHICSHISPHRQFRTQFCTQCDTGCHIESRTWSHIVPGIFVFNAFYSKEQEMR